MLVSLLYYLFCLLIYTPKSYKICENGYHDYGHWIDYARYHKFRICIKCGQKEIKYIGNS